MSVWFAIPSARPVEQALPVIRQWQQRGYKIALFTNPIRQESPYKAEGACDLLVQSATYRGYAAAVNELCGTIIGTYPHARWIVTGGDDTLPDPNHCAEEIARECGMQFTDTFGVMQPTGDDWADSQGRIIERVAGSPWMGREFCRRMYQGRGPLCEEYFHMGEDEELQAVATALGVFWQRPDLIHHHKHWGRPLAGEKMAHVSRRPAFLDRANSSEEWYRYKGIFAERQRLGWPGSEPIV